MYKKKSIYVGVLVLFLFTLLSSCSPKMNIPPFTKLIIDVSSTVSAQYDINSDTTHEHQRTTALTYSSKRNSKLNESFPKKLLMIQQEKNEEEEKLEVGEQPMDQSNKEILEHVGTVDEEKVENEAKKVALTFDDGPHPENTLKIVELLEKYDAKATFFQLGSLVKEHPEITMAVHQAGHEVASHTWNHPDLRSASVATIEKEILLTHDMIEEVTGAKPLHFRPPYGSTNQSIQAIANQYGQKEILWTLDTLDWKTRSAQHTVQIVKEQVQSGSIVLMHDIHDSTVEAMESILQYLQSEGYEMVTVHELE